MRGFMIFVVSALISGCVGTDFLDDPKDSAILVEDESVVIMVGATRQIEAVYWYNMWVDRPEVQLSWQSQNPAVASVDQNGLVAAHSKGQTEILITYAGEDTAKVNVNVVETNASVARVEVASTKTSFNVGETIQLTATAYNIDDVEIEGLVPAWSSENGEVVSVDDDGLATGVSNGETQVFAVMDDVSSTGYKLVVGAQARNGTFQGVNDYTAKGTATLTLNDLEELELTFSSDFETSFALGTFVYLANSTSGTVVRTQGLEIAEVTTNGAKSYNVSTIDGTVTLEDYQYVVLLCKPASVTFGFAELN